MKSAFAQYYTPTSREFAQLLTRALIVVDTSVLLNSFRASERTTSELFEVLIAAKAQLWMPYHVGYEYHENVDQTITEVMLNRKKLSEAVRGKLNSIRIDIRNYRHPFLSEQLLETIDKYERDLSQLIENEDELSNQLRRQHAWARTQIQELYGEANIGASYSQQELTRIYEEGKRRQNDRIPPGFKDAEKAGPRKFGDFIIWRQMIDKAKESKRDIVLVSDDAKEDWWLKIHGEKRGPLPALRAEMKSESGQQFYA